MNTEDYKTITRFIHICKRQRLALVLFLILRSKTETALYHITIHNEFTENDLYEFIGCPKDEEGDYDFIKD